MKNRCLGSFVLTDKLCIFFFFRSSMSMTEIQIFKYIIKSKDGKNDNNRNTLLEREYTYSPQSDSFLVLEGNCGVFIFRGLDGCFRPDVVSIK